jgi:hypothetical protein
MTFYRLPSLPLSDRENPPLHQSPAPPKNGWRERLLRSGFFLGAVLFHLILILLFASWVIWKAPPPPPPDEFEGVAVKVPPTVQPPPSGASTANPHFEPDQVVVPVVTMPSVISTAASSFSVDTSKILNQTLNHMSDQLAKGTGLDAAGGGSGSGSGTAFGSTSGANNQFCGYFYDLKQTPDHQTTGMDLPTEESTIAAFCRNGWNEDDLASHFFKSPKPLYTNQFMIPIVFSTEGPKAFGLDGVCQPGFWLAVYHVEVKPTHSGTYHVGGYGDDFLIVRVDGNTVLESGFYPNVTDSRPTQIYNPTWGPPNIQSIRNADKLATPYQRTVVGESFELMAGSTTTIDVLIGDDAAAINVGLCGYSLFLVEDGKDYPKDPTGFPILPLLQVQPDKNVKRDGIYPPFSCSPEDALSAP